MNNLLAPIYESFFDWVSYQDLLNAVFDQFDYEKFGWIILLVPAVLLFLFYKVWDPVSRPQRLKFFLVLILIFVIIYFSVSGILYSNSIIQISIDQYRAGSGEINPHWYIFQVGIISLILLAIISIVYTFIFKRFSTNNSHNPF